jgi:hypothetical protein
MASTTETVSTPKTPAFKYVMANYEFSYSCVWKVPVDWDEDKIGVRWGNLEYEGLSKKKTEKLIKPIYTAADFEPDFKRAKELIIGDKQLMSDEGYDTCEGSDDEDE